MEGADRPFFPRIRSVRRRDGTKVETDIVSLPPR
jgi:hypothetical protein